MDISNIPPEILSLILGELFEYRDDDDPESPLYYQHLRNARLVCRQWNTIAAAYLFRTVTFDAGPEEPLWSCRRKAWRSMANSEMIQRVAQNVVIYSSPDSREMEGDSDGSDEEEGGATKDDDRGDNEDLGHFAVAVRHIARLPNLKSLQINFAEKCLGAREDDELWDSDEDTESISHRLQTLRTVFTAIQKRRTAFDNEKWTSTIRSLTLKHLQNVPIPEFTSSDLYKDVIKDIHELHLFVGHEYNEHGPDYDLDRIERRTYEPYLERELLPPLAYQLRSLTLTFRERWGTVPAHFDGKGLYFPNLKTLTVGEFGIAHHDHFDWVLAQTSLETLRLDRCTIVSHLRILNDQWAEWRVPTHDWHKYPEGAFGFEGSYVFGFDGTWETVYDRIRESLPKLREFGDVYHRYQNTFDRRETMGASLSPFRYIVFDSGLCPSPWLQADRGREGSSELSFGNNDPAICPRDATPVERYRPKKTLDRAKETELGDARAFQELLRVVRERQ